VADTSVGLQLGYSTSCDATSLRADEAALVAGLREGAEAAYEEMIQKFQPAVYNLVSRLMDDPQDSLDVVQDVFLKIFRNISGFRGQSSLKTWIYRIAINEAHNYRRWFSRHRRQEVELEKTPEAVRGFQDLLPDPGRSPYEIALGREQRVLIEDALARLNPRFREAVVLRDIEDLSYEEIGEILDLSLGTVKSRILRGREALRKQLAGRLSLDPQMELSPQLAE
jgi:RNA polymerase sigma-70 factor (ECF subfamily)